MADTVITPNNQQVRFRGKGNSMAKSETEDTGPDPADEATDRAGQLHKKGLISDKALAETRAKAKKAKGGLPKIDRQEGSKNSRGENDPADEQIEGGGAQNGIDTGKGKDDPAPKKRLALDDDGDHEYR